MRSFGQFAMIALGAVLLCGVGSASARTIGSFEVRGWSAKAFADDKTGKFTSCVATADYRSGMTLGFMISEDFSWSMALFDTPTKFNKGQSVNVAYQIDGGTVHRVAARAANTDFVFAPLPDDVDLFSEFRLGRLLRVSVAGQIASFRLDGTAAMLSALLECAHRYQNTPAVSSAPPPAETARKDKPASGASPAPKEISTGSGFFVTADGVALTNAHVVENCEDAVISGYGKTRIVARDEANDLALLKVVEKTATTPARFRRKPVQLGETTFVMGFPLAGQLDNGLNFTSGIISSLAGPGNDTRALQLTAPIQSGNSGGPIVDSSGLVVGVTQAKMSEIAAIKEGGPFPQNVNFGIKADLAANFMRANAVDPAETDTAEPQPAVNIARDGRAFTVQVKCTVK